MRAFLDRVSWHVASAEDADGIWRMFADDAWFRDELARQARGALKAKRQPWSWQEDVVNEALLRFREQLRKQPDLRVDRQRVETTFPGWIGARLRFACSDAVDFLHRLHGRHLPAVVEPCDHRAPPPVDVWIDMRMAIDALEEPIRSVMLLHEIKRPMHEIAEAVGCSFWETRRLLHLGLEQLTRRLRDYRVEKQRREGPTSSSPATPT